MAGSYGSKQDPKINSFVKNSNETLKDFSLPPISENKLFGTLIPGQSVELAKKENNQINWNKEFLSKNLNQEHVLLIKDKNQETEKEIKDLLLEIKKLSQNTQELQQEIVHSVDQNIPDFNEYQLTFLQRIKNIVVNFRKNINEASNWLELFNHKKNKKNAFWQQARSKNGGEQYLMSSEHSASRSSN